MTITFKGKTFTFRQPDGTEFKVKGWGNQHHAVFETLDGYTVVEDPETGFYQYCELSQDRCDLEPLGVRADRFDGQKLNLQPGLRTKPAIAKARGMEGFRLMGSGRRCQQRQREVKARLQAAMLIGGPAAAPPRRRTVGDYVGLCLLIDFSDEPATIERGEIERFCNLRGYTGFGNNGSVRDYFLDNSNGRFNYTNIVPAYYRARHPKSYYTNWKIPHGTRARQLIREALAHLQSQGFDFSQLTVDSAGYIYAINVLYAGFCPNNWRQGLWPHAWSLAAPFDLGGGRKAFDYQFTDMRDQMTLGTFCHENGHMVCDYPDLYDYGDESAGVGAFCLMCAGDSDDKNPAQISAYLRFLSGWAGAVTTIEHGAEISLSSRGAEFAIHRRSPTEYFILENRSQTGRDASLPAAGLAIWHVDELGDNNNEQMTPTEHYELSLEQADGHFHLEKGVNPGDSGDLFRATHRDVFSDSSTPSSKWWDGSPSSLEIFDVGEHAEVMIFRARLHEDADAVEP